MANEQIALGRQRFDFYLDQIQELFIKSTTVENPGLFVYQQNIRTPFFMLEALCRIYRELHNKKTFRKLNELFKVLEDHLGMIDYYDGFNKEFSAKENIPASLKDYIKGEMEKKLGEFNLHLQTDGWIDNDNKRIRKIKARLDKVEWMTPSIELKYIKIFYKDDIASIVKAIKKDKINFDNVETDVHELRREIRWLSIFPQALRGVMQLKQSTETPEYLKKYLTPEIINSPFNKMPDFGVLNNFIYLDAGHFYAMSWLIAALGKLKDNGLRLVVLSEAIHSTEKLSDDDVDKKALSFCDPDQLQTKELLQKAKSISDTFFSEKILEKLLVS